MLTYCICTSAHKGVSLLPVLENRCAIYRLGYCDHSTCTRHLLHGPATRSALRNRLSIYGPIRRCWLI